MLRALNRVFTRILLLVILALAALMAVGAFVISQSRELLFEQKRPTFSTLSKLPWLSRPISSAAPPPGR
jgi:lipopolysaccharide/colanic/teichoic acid biosynthesis glycosyltransferase